MKFIDTHAHIYDLAFKEGDNLESMVDRSKLEGVENVYMPNLNLETLPRMLEVEERFPDFCKSMVGLHPCDVGVGYEVKLRKLERWLEKRSFVAIGEMGIDLYHSRAYEKEQVAAFEIQAAWARAYELPLVIHCREAFDELLALLERLQDGKLRGVIHCFTGTLEQARRCIALGFYLGIGGIVTYKKATLGEVVKELPLDHLVLETDSPYLAPVPKRGRQNEPSYVPYIAGKVAELKELQVEEVAAATTGNALALFG